MDQKNQMKDYYKIIGVKPIASPEEIHARWIDLMRKFHPNGGKHEAFEDERAREINEAYGVLKDSSSRSEYDLRRAYQRKKKRLYLQRVVTPLALFITLLILGLVYLQRPGSVRRAKSSLPSTRGSIQNTTDPLSSPAVNELNVPTHTNPRNTMNVTNQQDEIDRMNQMDQRESPRHPNPTPTPKSHQSPHINTKTGHINQKDQKDETNKIGQTNKKDGINTKKPRNPISPKNQPLPMNASKERKASPPFAKAETSLTVNAATPLPGEPSHTEPLVSQLKQPSSGITEEEVRQFLEYYKERYVHQDIDGFLSLFSPKAVQNGRDGFDGIKKLYSDFFHQSNKIQYHLEETRIEIYRQVLISGLFYEHAAQVEARYQVDQKLVKKGKKKVWRGDIRWILVRENGALKILYLRFKHKERG